MSATAAGGGAILSDLLARVTEAGRSLVGPSARKREEESGAELVAICRRLVAGRGEATSLALARSALDLYATLGDDERLVFFRELASRFGVDVKRAEAAIERWRRSGEAGDARAIHDASEPISQELIRRLNRAPGGARALVAIRGDLLKALKAEPALGALDRDFQHLFGSWFNRGFLQLRRLEWTSPANVLEKIIRYEAVHDINGWDDLRRRVGSPDRRLYAFFHPALADDPLIFVEVALTDGAPAAIGPILEERRAPLDPRAADTAVFYSISNCQVGLRGVSFGNFLIKQVVEELSAELPGLKTYVTLSPAPGLRAWAAAEAEKGGEGLLTEAERHLVGELERPDLVWGDIAERGGALTSLAARYFLEAKSRSGGPADPVARFHLGNGARLDRINPCADASPRGVANAWGVMVNYRYALGDIEKNHEAFAATGEVAAAPAVRRQLASR